MKITIEVTVKEFEEIQEALRLLRDKKEKEISEVNLFPEEKFPKEKGSPEANLGFLG